MLFILQLTIFLFLALLLLCIALSLLYAAPSISPITYFTSILTWLLTFGLILLVPLDISVTYYLPPQLASTMGSTLKGAYFWLYWLVYLLTWTIVPLVQEYEEAGDLNHLDRLKRSFYSNATFYLYLLLAALLFILIMWWVYPGLFSSQDLLKTLGYCYGTFLLMVLLSYSLYYVPSGMWSHGSFSSLLKHYKSSLQKARIQLNQSIYSLQEISALSIDFKLHANIQLQPYVDIVHACLPSSILYRVQSSYQTVIQDAQLVVVRDVEGGIGLHSSARRGSLRYKRAKSTVQGLEQSLQRLQQSINEDSILLRLYITTQKVLAVICAMLGFVLIVSQWQLFFQSHPTLLKILLLRSDELPTQLAVLLALLFISIMSFIGMFAFKVSHYYGLYPHATDGASLMFATVNFSRVSAPLVLNFMEMMGAQESVYIELMGKSSSFWLVEMMPMVLVVLMMGYHWDVWRRMLAGIGLTAWQFEVDEPNQDGMDYHASA